MPGIHHRSDQHVAVETPTTASRWLTSQRVAFYCYAVLVCEVVVAIVWWWRHSVQHAPGVPLPGGIDFTVYWSASAAALARGAIAAYDGRLLALVEATILPKGAQVYMPFVYPPTFLLSIYPLAMLPFGAALTAFSTCGVALYILVVRHAARIPLNQWLAPALAFPGLWVALACGQNSLFTLTAAGAGLLLLESNPIAAGACIAALCVKPQFGVLFPLVLIAGRRWRAFGSAALFSLLYCGLTAALLGIHVFVGFAREIAVFNKLMLIDGGTMWRGMPTVFAATRAAGWSLLVSCAAHAAVAVPAVAACMWLWWKDGRFELRAAAFCIATLLVQPYLLHYDLAWIALPLAFIAADFARHGFRSTEAVVFAEAWLVPAQAFATALLPGQGQWAPVVLGALMLVVMVRNAKKAKATTSQ